MVNYLHGKKSADATSIVELIEPTIDFWIRPLSADKVVAAVEETPDVNAVISVYIELPEIDFSLFDEAFDAAIKEAHSICRCSKFSVVVSFARVFPTEISDSLL